jgi:hypothetical protein
MSDERAATSRAELPAAGPGQRHGLSGRGDRHWQPPTRQQFEELLRGALKGCEQFEYRQHLGWHCWDLMDRAWYRRGSAVDARKLWNKFRYAAAVVPVIAAGAGGSLVGHVHGTAGTVIGWVALIGGIVGAAINAVRPAVEYGVDVTKAAQFEQLYWDIFNYSMTGLRLNQVEQIAPTLDKFAQRMTQIAVVSGGSTATAS